MIDDAPIRPKKKRSTKDYAIDRLKKSLEKWKEDCGKWRRAANTWEYRARNADQSARSKFENIEKSISKVQHIELMMRAIIAYHKLSKEGIFSIREFVILATGSHTEVFTKKDLKDRYEWGWMTRDLNSMVRAGFIKMIPKSKGRYFMTPEGKKRMNDIMEHIYGERRIKYRIARKHNKNESQQRDVPAVTDTAQG